jgi:AcrR family transcriptional regulator
VSAQRLPAAERRQALVDAAVRVFSARGYAGATTAEIAREAGISEPILYRHFRSKRELYLACVQAAWEAFRVQVEQAIAETDDPGDYPLAIARAARAYHERRQAPTILWIQALTEAADDPQIRRFLRRHLREAHAFIRGIIEEGRSAGGIPADRDVDAEAWISLSIGLLRSVSERLGGLLGPDELAAVADARALALSGNRS